jgi:hypothetical protein
MDEDIEQLAWAGSGYPPPHDLDKLLEPFEEYAERLRSRGARVPWWLSKPGEPGHGTDSIGAEVMSFEGRWFPKEVALYLMRKSGQQPLGSYTVKELTGQLAGSVPGTSR